MDDNGSIFFYSSPPQVFEILLHPPKYHHSSITKTRSITLLANKLIGLSFNFIKFIELEITWLVKRVCLPALRSFTFSVSGKDIKKSFSIPGSSHWGNMYNLERFPGIRVLVISIHFAHVILSFEKNYNRNFMPSWTLELQF